MDISADTITIMIGVITLIIGVINSIITNRQTVQSHNLQVILSVSESFRQDWESKWSGILDELNVDHIKPRTENLPKDKQHDIRFMLNWVDWLGAMKSSGALHELDILTSSIGIPIKRIINAGYTLVQNDTKTYGADYWKNLFLIAEHLNIKHALEIKNNNSKQFN